MIINTHINKVLIDADSIVYITAWDAKELDNTPENYAMVVYKTDMFMHNILNATRAERYVGFLKGSQPTFRHIANPEYKAKRKGTDWLNKWAAVIRHRLITGWKLIPVEGMEADDAISMMANSSFGQNAIIAQNDKDLNQVPGHHYDYKKLVAYDVTEDEAQRNLFVQVLMGDTTDNIPGVEGIGIKTAQKLLVPGTGDYYQVVLNIYIQNYGEREGIIAFYENYLMCKLLDAPSLGFKPEDILWTDFIPDDTFIPKPEEISLTEEEPSIENFNPTNTQDHGIETP